MKFLILLSVLATTSVFAQRMGGDKIKCWDSAQENRHHKPAYVFEEKGRYEGTLNREIKLVYPNYIQLEEKHGCLVSSHRSPPGANEPRNEFEACLGEGQYINRLVPVEIDDEEEDFEGTVYCEREIKDFLGRGRHDN